MKVRSGWNSEFGRKKFDIELDGEDLVSLLIDAGIPGDAPLSFNEKYQFLYVTAEILARLRLLEFDPTQDSTKVKELQEKRLNQALKLRDKYQKSE